MKTQVTSVKKTEYLVIVLTLTIIFGLVGKGVQLLYCDSEKCKFLVGTKSMSQAK